MIPYKYKQIAEGLEEYYLIKEEQFREIIDFWFHEWLETGSLNFLSLDELVQEMLELSKKYYYS